MTLNDIGPVVVRGSWLDRIESFGPQVIHSALGTVRTMKIVSALADRFGIPIVPHFLDDWPSTMFGDGRLFGMPRRTVGATLDRVMTRSPVRLAIGDDMAREFEVRFGGRWVTVGNSVDFGEYDALVRQSPQEAGPVAIMRYAGGLHLGRAAAIGRVAAMIDASGRPWRLVVHAPTTDQPLAQELAREHECVEAGPLLNPQEVAPALAGSDALLFIESDDPAIYDFTRLSVSTKVPEYLATTRPVLVIGPERQASVRALLRGGRAWYGGRGTSTAEFDAALRSVETARRDDAEVPAEGAARSTFDRRCTQERLRHALADAVDA